jgi:spermidine synthase
MGILSVNPPTQYLTFGPWIYLVPQYKPSSVLILGYAGGTVAGLIRLLYGDDVPIVAVDIEPCVDTYNVSLVQADAKEYVKTCGSFDCVIVDIFDPNVNQAAEFVYNDEEFAANLTRIANYIIVNTINDPGLWFYRDFERVRVISVENNNITYFKKPGVDLGILPNPPSEDGTIAL